MRNVTFLNLMADFTMDKYRDLCDELLRAEYKGIRIEQYAAGATATRFVMLRHDVDSWPVNALLMASLERSLGLEATYYFRRSPLSEKHGIIESIAGLGHEIGYHYEDLATHKGDYEKAYEAFRSNLTHFRQFYPVKTAAMHGRPLSHWDSKDLWNRYDYRELSLICEPYLDIDFTQVAYLTDTGNCWDGEKYSVRDHVTTHFRFPIHTTDDLINHIREGLMPDKLMLNVHPARWNNNPVKWFVRDYILSRPKYIAKKWLKKRRSK